MGTNKPLLAAVIAAMIVGLTTLSSLLGIDLPFAANLGLTLGG